MRVKNTKKNHNLLTIITYMWPEQNKTAVHPSYSVNKSLSKCNPKHVERVRLGGVSVPLNLLGATPVAKKFFSSHAGLTRVPCKLLEHTNKLLWFCILAHKPPCAVRVKAVRVCESVCGVVPGRLVDCAWSFFSGVTVIKYAKVNTCHIVYMCLYSVYKCNSFIINFFFIII